MCSINQIIIIVSANRKKNHRMTQDKKATQEKGDESTHFALKDLKLKFILLSKPLNY